MNWKHYSSVTLLFLACAVFLLPTPPAAKTDVVYASYKYVMGDNDTKNDAKRICFIEAKRRCLEKVGTYIESETEVTNFNLTKDQIRTYTAALAKVEIVAEQVQFEGESVAIFMTVRAIVDSNHIEQQLNRIQKDRDIQKKLNEKQKQLDDLDKKYKELKARLATAEPTDALEYRKQRSELFEEMSEIEKRYHHMKKVINDRTAKHVELSQNILKYIEIGMEPEDVEYILGKPDKQDGSSMYSALGMYYGNVMIFFHNGYVSSISLVKPYNGSITLKEREYNVLEDGIIINKMIHESEKCKEPCRHEIQEVVKKYVLGY